MCGITGWIVPPGSEPALNILERMSEAIRHRGPDDQGIYQDSAAGVALAFRRLSIIDLTSASHQPMVDVDSGAALVYNGEIYNFRLLRSELQSLGHVFGSQGDAEVVLKSYLQWGVECFVRFSGMFALALWDPRSGTLHLARDPMGMKPLYYVKRPQGTFFASEIKAFAFLDDFRLEPGRLGLRQYLEFGYVFDENETFVKDVAKLPPGCRMELRSDGHARIHRHFSFPSPRADDRLSETEMIEELGEVLGAVVAEHLVSDVPVALLLSGGLDSSVLSALAARHARLSTICAGFAGADVDERPLARQVSEHIGSTHQEILVTPQQLMTELSGGVEVLDDLFSDWGTITNRLLYRRCRELGMKVILVGEGADELFGGYEAFEAPQPLGLWQRFRLYRRYSGRRYGRLFPSFSRIMGQYLEASGGDAFQAVRLFETRRQLPNQFAMKVDKASMAEGIEARAPYLDRRVAELALRTPRQWLLRGGENKYLLRALARSDHLLPDNIGRRRKFGAPLPYRWMDDDASFRRFARDRLLQGVWCRRLGLESAMRAYFDDGRQGYAFPRAISIFSDLAWRLLLLELWSQNYARD